MTHTLRAAKKYTLRHTLLMLGMLAMTEQPVAWAHKGDQAGGSVEEGAMAGAAAAAAMPAEADAPVDDTAWVDALKAQWEHNPNIGMPEDETGFRAMLSKIMQEPTGITTTYLRWDTADLTTLVASFRDQFKQLQAAILLGKESLVKLQLAIFLKQGGAIAAALQGEASSSLPCQERAAACAEDALTTFETVSTLYSHITQVQDAPAENQAERWIQACRVHSLLEGTAEGHALLRQLRSSQQEADQLARTFETKWALYEAS